MHIHSIHNEVIERLLPGPQPVPDLVAELSFTLKVSPQGVYKAIRLLRENEIITISQKAAALSLIWLDKEKQKIEFAERAYQSQLSVEKFFAGTSSRQVFTFKTLNEIDLFWTHTYNALAANIETDQVSYSIQPHDWYMYVQTDTDAYWVKQHQKVGRLARIVITHSTELDQKVMRARKQAMGKLFEFTVGVNPLKQKSFTYYNLLGPFIFKADFDRLVSAKLDKFVSCQKDLPLAKLATKEIKDLVQEKGKFTLTITRSETKANAMRKKILKYFA